MKKRFMVYDRQESPLFDLDVSAVEGEGAVRYEKLNGEHKLDVTTTQTLQEGLRILSQDGTEKWREWVIDEPAEAHEDGYLATYGCTWSMQYDLATVSGGELWPGTYEPITAGAALTMVLGVQSRWEVGNVTVSGTAGTTLYDGQVWDYLGKLQEVWGGEMESRIVVDSNGIVHRYVDWLAHVGSTTAKRRFDYGEDCTAIRQKVDPGPRYCWVEPRGGKDATDEDGISYSERVGVEEEPADSGDGWAHDADSKFVRDPDAEADFKQPDGNGGWHYPVKVVIYDSDDPEELLEMAVADLHNHTRPKTSYEADVLQFAAAGMDPHGVALGDEVQIVDKTFGDAPLRLEARIVEITVNELDETDVQLVIGEANKGLDTAFKSMRSAIDAAEERSRRIEGAGTIVYLQNLLDELNAEINASGGYGYFVNGEGIITYDKRVADPLVGTEADQVTQIKGGNIRIANEKKTSFAGINDWKWKTVIVSGHLAAELVTAVNIVAGYIGNAGAGSYWDLDNDTFRIGTTATLGNKTVQELLADVSSAGIDSIQYGTSASSSTEPSSWSTTVPSSVTKGSWLWIKTTYKNNTTSVTKAYAGTDGTNGQDGDDGIGISSITPQYYLSTSSSSATGGSWSSSPPTWSASHYIWTRSEITWDTTPATTTYTTAVYDAALTQANENAVEAAKTATNFLTFDSTNGLDVGYSGTSAKTRINADGMEVFDGNGNSALFAGIESSTSIVRVGQQSGSGNVLISSDGYVDIRNGSTVTAHFGWGTVNIYNGTTTSSYFSLGTRKSGYSYGKNSLVAGEENAASGYLSSAIGYKNIVTGRWSCAIGYGNEVSADYGSVALGYGNKIKSNGADIVAGYGLNTGTASQSNQSRFVCGTYNSFDQWDVFEVGWGSSQSPWNAMSVTTGGVVKCYSVQQSSDRRVKTHLGYIEDDEAIEFIDALKPAKFILKDAERIGFYAQDVEETEYGDILVSTSNNHGYEDFRTLDYTSIIAPLVAYAQSLEKRIDQQQETIEALTKRLDALEGR